jgi:predicted enzyme related to lactoylglutathione lyase
MLDRTGYPAGVPCWVDVILPDPDAAMAFYGDLFGWTYEVRTPADAPTRYAYALLDGSTVGGVGGPPDDKDRPGWTSYICVDSADDTAAAVEANGGRVLTAPVDVSRAGRSALCADPEGAVFGLWQPGENRGAQVVNAPGSWNFGELHTADPDGAERFYGAVFGWLVSAFEFSTGDKGAFWRLPGYGELLAESDPEIRERQAADGAPGDFVDAVAVTQPLAAEGAAAAARWTVTLAVADADAAFGRALELGASEVVPLFDTQYTRQGTIRDPQGAELTLSEYRPPTT